MSKRLNLALKAGSGRANGEDNALLPVGIHVVIELELIVRRPAAAAGVGRPAPCCGALVY